MTNAISISIYSRSTKLKAFFLSVFGTIVEYYDYALYGFCASQIADVFFPNHDPTVALIKTYGVFALGSIAKPLGSLLFGWLGDRRGRKTALRWSMLGIAVPTLIISLTPTYHDIGWWAPVILIGCRFTQGFFLSGEFDGVRVFIYETMGRQRPYFVNSLVGLAAFMGIFCASFSASTLAPIHWRLPFYIGGLAGLLVLLSRRLLIESEDYRLHTAKKTQFVTPNIKKLLRPFLAAVLLCGSVGGGYHIFFVYLSTHFSSSLHILSSTEASWMTTQLLSCYIPSLLLGALLADRFKAIPILSIGAVAVLFHALLLLDHEIILWKLYPLAIALGLLHAPGYVLLLKQFPLSVRYRCVSLSHALGSMLFSGTAPLICTLLWQITAWPATPFIHLIFLTLLSGVSLLLLMVKTK